MEREIEEITPYIYYIIFHTAIGSNWYVRFKDKSCEEIDNAEVNGNDVYLTPWIETKIYNHLNGKGLWCEILSA